MNQIFFSISYFRIVLYADIIVVLLEHGIQLGDALLRAVDEQFVYAAQILCEHIKQKNIPVSKMTIRKPQSDKNNRQIVDQIKNK